MNNLQWNQVCVVSTKKQDKYNPGDIIVQLQANLWQETLAEYDKWKDGAMLMFCFKDGREHQVWPRYNPDGGFVGYDHAKDNVENN